MINSYKTFENPTFHTCHYMNTEFQDNENELVRCSGIFFNEIHKQGVEIITHNSGLFQISAKIDDLR